jgi:hypothetical protein
MLALSFDISKNHDIEFYDIHGLQNLFCGEVILKGLVFLYHKILKKKSFLVKICIQEKRISYLEISR